MTEKQRMKEYIIKRLRQAGEKAEPVRKRVLSVAESNLILVPGSGIIFLVDREYSKEMFEDIYWRLGEKTAYVFYKDGKISFNRLRRKNYSKRKSLRGYTKEELSKLVFLTEAEKMIHFKRKAVQYYQPESSRQAQGIETYFFEPIEFDYNNLSTKLKSLKRKSKRLFFWTDRSFGDSDLILRSGLLIPRQDSKLI